MEAVGTILPDKYQYGKKGGKGQMQKKKTVQGRFVLTCQKLLFLRELTLLARPSAM